MNTFLVVRLGSLGDIIHTWPVAAAIKRHMPNSRVAWLTEKRYAELVRLNPQVDRVMTVALKRLRRRPAGVLRQLRKLRAYRRERFACSLDFQGNLKSGVLSRMVGAGKRVGFAAALCRERVNAWFNNQTVDFDIRQHRHIITRNLQLLTALGIKPGKPTFDFSLDAGQDTRVVDQCLRGNPEGVIGLSMSAGFATKLLPTDWWRKVLSGLLAAFPDHRLLLFWGPGEEARVHALVSRCGRERQRRIIIPPATTLVESVYLLNHLDLFIAGDTGPLHIADALGRKCVGIFTCTDPRRNGPYHNLEHTVASRAFCGPCYKRTCPMLFCNQTIDFREVLRKARELLQ